MNNELNEFKLEVIKTNEELNEKYKNMVFDLKKIVNLELKIKQEKSKLSMYSSMGRRRPSIEKNIYTKHQDLLETTENFCLKYNITNSNNFAKKSLILFQISQFTLKDLFDQKIEKYILDNFF